MDKDQFKKTISEYYLKLPENLQVFFSDKTWISTIQEISTRYNLPLEHQEFLLRETTLVLLCILPLDEYLKNIKSEIKIQEEKFNSFVGEINEGILKNIGFDLEETFLKNANTFAENKYNSDNQKIDERFSSLPKEVQIAINESNYQAALYKIAEKYQLNIEQMGIFEEITTKVMLGIINPDNYQQEISSKLNIDVNKVANIVKDVNDNVLGNIKELLKKHWSENNTTEDHVPIPPYKKDAPENKPVVESQPNILEDKLTKPVISETSTSIHKPEIKKEEIDNSHDPYREII